MADLLIIAPHPDDAEIHAGATIAAHVRSGRSVAVVDATRGELGSRGDPATRANEAAAAAGILGLSARENLDLPDGFLRADDLTARERIVAAIRRHRPRAVIGLSPFARHPDHLALAELLRGSVKAAALHALPAEGHPAVAGVRLWYCEAELPIVPGFLLPATEADWQRKLAAVRCYGSQLHQPGSTGPATSISTPEFLGWIEHRGRTWGYQAGAAYAEAFHGPEAPRINDLTGC
ncbi:bacillithiol biosynthesis deacetylase BshB1 [Planctomycetota bacterium]|nr:bacillithiol biosynthesis deacetylase BshB1 [Planctomycetota bacterium]